MPRRPVNSRERRASTSLRCVCLASLRSPRPLFAHFALRIDQKSKWPRRKNLCVRFVSHHRVILAGTFWLGVRQQLEASILLFRATFHDVKVPLVLHADADDDRIFCLITARRSAEICVLHCAPGSEIL